MSGVTIFVGVSRTPVNTHCTFIFTHLSNLARTTRTPMSVFSVASSIGPSQALPLLHVNLERGARKRLNATIFKVSQLRFAHNGCAAVVLKCLFIPDQGRPRATTDVESVSVPELFSNGTPVQSHKAKLHQLYELDG